ncbi:MAG: hypothetical protein ACRDT1_17845, partial [Micromonosporaceae bacterium]
GRGGSGRVHQERTQAHQQEMKTWPRSTAGQLLFLAVWALVGGLPAEAARPVDPDPFLVAPESIRGRFHRLALLPVNVIGSTWVPTTDTIFVAGLRSRLEARGHAVILPETVLASWRDAVTAAGGIFNRRSGRPDSARVRVAVESFTTRLRDSLGVDGLLRYGIWNVEAEWNHGEAVWDGVEQDTDSPGLLSTLMRGNQRGKIPALSLQVEFADLAGRTLYVRRAGLATLNTMVKGRWVGVSEAVILGDTLVKRRAMDRAVGPWLERMSP